MSSISPVPKAFHELTREDFDAKMKRAFDQSEKKQGMSSDDFFALLQKELKKYA